MDQRPLFDAAEAPPLLPPGGRYEEGFLTPAEQAHWLEVVRAVPLAHADYKGHTARRRVASFGGRYDFDAHRLDPAPPLPPALWPLRDRVAAWMGVAPQALVQALVAEYAPGTPLGWHRDVPDFERIAGVSLGTPAVLCLRPWPPTPGGRVCRWSVAPGSVYELAGSARWGWQHQVPPVPDWRWSVTFRTAREQ
ncbi:alpha-ketoglutarate-dependent dioxygenase AlkB [Ideonella sp.]|uniref:alpha-ketoglutarate-dependent dioxygenase AlkB n=1 Tax=Ideonella sp. TaxID=1929293 RepID=UPI0035B3DBE8